MANPTRQQYADLAADVYNTRTVTQGDNTISIGGNSYKVLAVSNQAKGYQGAVYQDAKTNAVIVAHRGTEGLTKDWKDAATDGVMVFSRHNDQAKAAVDLTKQAMAKLKELHEENPTQPMPTLTHTGHSLGGSLAQISAHYFDQGGVTFNAYGAASLGRIPEGGSRVTNYVKATDPVAAASPHYGKVEVLATQDEINRLSAAGYTNSKVANALLPSSTVKAAGSSVGSAHSISNFTGNRSILSDPNARRLAETNKVMIDAYRDDVEETRFGLSILGISPKNIGDFIKGDRPAGEPARKNLPPLSQAPDISQPLEKNATDRDFINGAVLVI